MIARLTKDTYIDLVPYFPYEITRVFYDGHIKLQGSPRRYESKYFDLNHDGKKITHEEAYELYKEGLEVVEK